jgi:hypothetical protein
VPFPWTDPYWSELGGFLSGRLRPGETLLAPHDLLELFASSYPYRALYALDPGRLDYVVLHKGVLHELGRAALDRFLRERAPVFANEVFVVLGRPGARDGRVEGPHVRSLHERLPPAPTPRPERAAALVTTYERPEALARSLPQVAALGAPVLVVDDGSGPEARERVEKLCEAAGARFLPLGENRGLPTAMNAGLAWWLADSEVVWISVFQDDVDVRPDCLAQLARVQDARLRPILSGRACRLHRCYGVETVEGVGTLRYRSLPGIHLHAHREYWRGVLPIPTPYLGAPKPHGGLPGQGSDEDFWVTCWSPRSIVKRGGWVTCVPGLVRTFAPEEAHSTWGARPPRPPDPPL